MHDARRGALRLAVLVGLSVASSAFAVVLGGGAKPRRDCWAVFDGVTATDASPIRVECADGDPSCDGDGKEDGCAVNGTVGLPAPGALILPVTAEWRR